MYKLTLFTLVHVILRKNIIIYYKLYYIISDWLWLGL